jgi:glucose-6-phosphate 1-epimerase
MEFIMQGIQKLDNGFEYIEIKNSVMQAKIALQGAHIYEYKRHNKKDILWLSECSFFERGKAIRGGIPICWPRFGNSDKSMPSHGFSRESLFSLVSVENLSEDETKVLFCLEDSSESRKIWDYKFRLEVVFYLGLKLKIELKTYNLDTKEFMITEALHTYFTVSDIQNIRIKGLESKPYLDTLTGKEKIQNGEITIDSECDRVYQDVEADISLIDREESLTLNVIGSSSAVVWNPWIEKGASMSGMKVDGYREFVCIESANAFEDLRVIHAGESHTLALTLEKTLNV